MFNYTVSARAQEAFKTLAQKSWVACKNDYEKLNFRIIQAFDMGEILSSDRFVIVKYGNLLVKYCPKSNTIMDIDLSEYPNESNQIINKRYKGNKTEYKIAYERSKKSFSERFMSRVQQITSAVHKLIVDVRYALSREHHAEFDATYKDQVGKMGAGFIIYKRWFKKNKVVFKCSIAIDVNQVDVLDSHEAEAFALKLLLEKIDELKISKVEIRGDNQGLMQIAKKKKVGKNKRRSSLDIVNYLNKRNNRYQFKWISRGLNTTAHRLAKMAV